MQYHVSDPDVNSEIVESQSRFYSMLSHIDIKNIYNFIKVISSIFDKIVSHDRKVLIYFKCMKGREF